MKKSKALHMLNLESMQDLTPGETTYFQDCEDLSLLQSNNYREISESHVTALMNSIQETGIQAEVALVASEGSEGQVVLTVEDGHHRLEAVRRLRHEAERSGRHWLYRPLPCRVRVTAADTVKGAFAIASVLRNQLRKEENLWDKLAAFERLREAGETTAGISKLVGLDERSVRRILSLRRIPDRVRGFAKRHEDSVKAATLYKLAAAIEKTSGEEDQGLASLLAEKAKDSPTQFQLAQTLAQDYLTQTSDSSVLAVPYDQGLAAQDVSDSSSFKGVDPNIVGMITMLAWDQIPKSKNDSDDRQSAESSRTSNHTSSTSTSGKSTSKPARSGAAKTKRQKLPEGWVALDPTRLDSMLSDAGIPEEWRSKLTALITSQNG